MSDYALSLFCDLQLQRIAHRLARHDSLSARRYTEPADRDAMSLRGASVPCDRCKKRQVIPRRKLCAYCTEMVKRSRDDRTAARIAQGKCLRCGAKAAIGRQLCAFHLEKANARVQADYHRKKRRGAYRHKAEAA